MKSSDSSNDHMIGQLSDQQMELLLRDFFAIEVPAVLPAARQPAVQLRRDLVDQSVCLSRSAISVRSSRLTAALALAALGLCAVLLNQDAERVAAMAARVNQPAATTDSMLVSPQGATKGRQVPVGADGLLLQETEQIEVHPQR